MALYRLGDNIPLVDPSAWIADSAHVIGRVELAAGTSVWFNAVLRGDNEPIRVGQNSNIQEASVLHTDIGEPLNIGAGVTVGHQAMLHGCTIEDGALIGIQAVVLNGAKIGRECLIGAGALVAEGKVIPERSLVLGSPGKVVRTLSDAEVARLREANLNYVERAQLFRQQLVRL